MRQDLVEIKNAYCRIDLVSISNCVLKQFDHEHYHGFPAADPFDTDSDEKMLNRY